MRKVYISAHETIVERTELDVLLRKEIAHDAMLKGYMSMMERQAKELYHGAQEPYMRGWLDCFRELATIVGEASNAKLEDAPPRILRHVQPDDLPF